MKLLVLICSLSMLATTACKRTVFTKKGELPAEYVDVAKNFTGSFHGSLNKEGASLNLYLVGKKPVLKINKDRNNLLISDCETSSRHRSEPKMEIGYLKNIVVDDKIDSLVYSMTFKLKHNCKNIQGKEITLLPSNDLNSYNIYITDYTWLSQFCSNGEFKERPASNSSSNYVALNSEVASLNIENRDRFPGSDFPDTNYETCFTYIKGHVKR